MGDDKTRLLCTAIGESTPWIYNNLPPEFENCMTITEPKSSFEKRYQQWTLALVRRMGILSELSDEKWNQRKKIVSPEIISLGVSNSRISQLLKEFVDEGIIERKRGEGRGEGEEEGEIYKEKSP